ncbi:MAG: hypothetical protein Tsb0026_02650 [Sulfuricaulis sp.]
MPPSMIALATASQPRQHMGWRAPLMVTEKSNPGGTPSPQWKQVTVTAGLAEGDRAAGMDMGG